VLWSNQSTRRFGFRVHADGADPATWSADEVPASQSAIDGVGSGMADDHLNVAVASDGTLYAAIKTGYDTSGYPLIGLLVRQPNGTWDDLHEVDQSGTRGIVFLDETESTVYVAYTRITGSSDIVYRESATSSIAFGPVETILSGSLNDVTSTKQNISGEVVLLASTSTQAFGVLATTAPVPSTLVGHWPMDEGTGTTIADVSDYGNDGTLLGGATWTPGVTGSAILLDGTDDYGLVPDAASLDVTDAITLAAWIRPGRIGTQYLVKKATQGGTDGYELSLSGSGLPFVRFNQSTSGNDYRVDGLTTYPTDGTTWMHLAATYDGSTIRIYVDGQEENTAAATFQIATNALDLAIGAQSDGASPLQGAMDDVRVYSRALSAPEIADLAVMDPLVGSWQMEENGGTVLADSSAYGNDGTLSGDPAWVPGVEGLALQLDGAGDYALVSDDESLDIVNAITLATWIRPELVGTQYLVKKAIQGGGDGYEISLSATGLPFARFNQTTSGNAYRIDGITPYPTDGATWMHLAVTYDGSTIRFYANGIEESSASAVFDIATNALPLGIGCQSDGTTTFTGAMDDARVYRRALSPAEIGVLAGYVDPLVGSFQMEEGSGTTLADSSSYGNDAALSGSPTWVPGIDGLAIELDGTSDYGLVPDDASLDITDAITLATWIRPGRVGTQYVLKKAIQGGGDGYELSLASSGVPFVRFNQTSAANTYRVDAATSYPTDGTTWMHLAATYDGATIRIYVNGELDGSAPAVFTIATNALSLGIGCQSDGTTPFQGAMDDARIYRRALSGDEIRALVVTDPLVGNWRMEENGGTVLADSSAYGNDGALSGDPAWVPGVVGLALQLDGGGDYALVPDDVSLDIADAITMAAWIRPDAVGTQYLVKKATNGGQDGYELALSSSGLPFVRFNQTSASNTYRVDAVTPYPTDGVTWMHLAATYDGSTVRIYVDGLEEGSAAAAFTIGTNDLPLGIGVQSDGASEFGGAMDEVRLYRRALGADEIFELALGDPFVGHWMMEEDGGSVMADSSAYGNDGTFVGDPTWVSGIDGLAIELDGVEDHGQVPDDASLDIPGDITLAAWIRPTVVGTQYLIKKANISVTDGYELSLSSSGKPFVRFNQFTNANDYRVDGLTSYPVDGTTWMHLAATYDGTMVRIYADGVPEDSLAAQFSIATNDLSLAVGAQSDGDRLFIGAMDDVRVYRRALTTFEIEVLAGVSVPVEETSTPWMFALRGNAPNPFNPLTRIRFELGAAGSTRLHVYDVSGRLVRTLIAGDHLAVGPHSVAWDGRNDGGGPVGSGVYYYRLDAEGRSDTGTMQLIR
jgi:hypothetical protein